MDPNLMVNRLRRLALLDTTVFDEVRDDERELIPAIAIVVLSTILAALGGWFFLLVNAPEGADTDFGNIFVKEILLGTLFSLALWVVWVAVVYVMLVQVFKAQTDIQMLIRTMGYASFPLAISLFMFIYGIALAIGIVALVLWFVMSTYAIQSTTAAGSDKVVLSNAVGFAVFAIVLAFLAETAGMGPGVFIFQPFGTIHDPANYYKPANSSPSLDDILNGGS